MSLITPTSDDASSAQAPLVEVSGLRIGTSAKPRKTIVSSVDLRLFPGETLGIVGESGSGKSMTARAIAGLLPSGVVAEGDVRYDGTDLLALNERERARLRGRDIGLVFQDPFTMLNPVLRVGEQILESVRDERRRRLRGSAARDEAIRRLREVGIDDPSVVDRYPFQLSGGMRQRVGIAAALAADPKVLIADEPATALDVTTQKEILDLLASLQTSRNMALALITHDLRVAFSVCDRVVVLYAGRLLEEGTGEQLDARPRHPYTLGLLLSEPDVDKRQGALAAIPGSVPAPDTVAHECPFAARCRWAADPCRAGDPPLVRTDDGRSTACVRLDDIAVEMVQARRATVTADLRGVTTRAPAGALLTVTGLQKRFGNRKSELVAVRDASITVGAGEAVGIVGESGSGKTTLARCVMGFESPTAGQIELEGLAVTGDHRMRAELARRVQMIYQDPYSSLNPRRSIGSTLAEALTRRAETPRDGQAAVAELLARVGLPAAYARRRPARLSGGERQRVAIARALAVEPKLLVCDEPVSALDVSVQAQVLNLLNQVRQDLGVAYLFITHDLAVVRQVVSRIYVMRKGEIVESGEVDRVLDAPEHEYTRRLVGSIPRLSAASPAP